MAGNGGSRILHPPSDDDVAPVIPLRQRQPTASGSPLPRRELPRERAAFDPEIEPADGVLGRGLRYRPHTGRLMTGLRRGDGLRLPPDRRAFLVVAAGTAVLALCVAALFFVAAHPFARSEAPQSPAASQAGSGLV